MFGEVLNCIVHTVSGRDIQKIRVFVEFKYIDDAIKADADLRVRTFIDKIIDCDFYSEENF